ncbi:MAG: riboflavin kinase, partial [Actinomycetota bacterium]
RGIYAGRAHTHSSVRHVAAINVGVNPTFGGDPKRTPWRVEAYFLDFDDDIYDQTLRIEFHHRLRDEEKFDSVTALLEQMGDDVNQDPPPDDREREESLAGLVTC